MNTEDLFDEDLTSGDPIDRLDELVSLHLDDCLTDDQATELNDLLLGDPEARKRLVEMGQLHADLYAFFHEPKTPSKISPALPLPIPGLGLPTTH